MRKRFGCAVLAAILMTILLAGCVTISFGVGGVVGEGPVERRLYDVGRFAAVEISGEFELIYRNGPEHRAEIEMQENLFEYLSVRAESGNLILESQKSLRAGAGKTLKLYITTPEFNALTIRGMVTLKDADQIMGERFDINVSGVCDLDLNLDVNSLRTTLSGAGTLSLSGNARSAWINLSGAGGIDALRLDTVDAEVILSGAGDCNIGCSGRLNAVVSGIGSLKYRGSAEIAKTVSGLGSIVRAE